VTLFGHVCGDRADSALPADNEALDVARRQGSRGAATRALASPKLRWETEEIKALRRAGSKASISKITGVGRATLYHLCVSGLIQMINNATVEGGALFCVPLRGNP